MPRLLLAATAVGALLASACLFDSDDPDTTLSPTATPTDDPTIEPTMAETAEPTPSPPPIVPGQNITEAPEEEVPVVNWYPLRYTGEADITLLNELFGGSIPLNEEVIYQLETVLEDSLGWQQSGLDFRRAREAPDSINDASVDMFVFVSSAENFPCETAGNPDSVVIACSVGGEFPTRLPCALIIPDFNRTVTAINHEVGHCLRIMHNPAPGVMSELLNNATEWPTEDEIAVVRRLLDPFRDDA